MANAKGLSLRGGQRPTWRPEREARGSALGVQSRSSRLHRGKVTGEIATAFPRLPRRFAPRNDTSGGYCGAPAPSSGLIPLCKALNERRYRRNRSVRFYRHLVRTGSAFPRLPRRFAPRNDTSGGYCGAPAPSSGLIPLCKALNERRYRRNRSVRFYRHLVRTGSAFPRLPRPLWGLAMTRQGSAAMGTVRRTASAVLLPLRGRAGHAPPLQGQCGLNDGRCESAMPSRDCHVASLLAMTRQGSAAMGTVRHTASAVLLPLRGRAWLSPPLQGQCGLNGGRRMIHSSFFSIHYSLFHPSPCGGWQTI